MPESRKKVRMISKKEFFNENAQDCSPEKLSEEVYVILHTVYLKDVENYKDEIKRLWKTVLNFPISAESYEYLRRYNSEFIRPTEIERLKTAKVIDSAKDLARTIVRLEFDLWIIEQLRIKGIFQIKEFERYLKDKYADYLNSAFHDFISFDLAYSKDVQYIARALDPYSEQIKTIFTGLYNANKTFIHLAAESINDKPASVTETTPVISVAQKEDAVTEKKPVSGNYEVIIAEQTERILRLENDIKEFKRQRDELRKYSVEQYDRGVMDLFKHMNDKRHGKIIDYFYLLLKNKSADEVLSSYIDNLFLLLEDMEIEPIIPENIDFDVNEDNMTKIFELDFRKKDYVKGCEAVKYVGWKYKDIIIEKPTLTIKEE